MHYSRGTRHEAGAHHWGIIISLIETCKLNVIDPQKWLASTRTAIVIGHKQSQINQLLPRQGVIATPLTYDGTDAPIIALADDGRDDLRQMLADIRCSAEEWDCLLDCFVSGPDIIARVKVKYPR